MPGILYGRYANRTPGAAEPGNAVAEPVAAAADVAPTNLAPSVLPADVDSCRTLQQEQQEPELCTPGKAALGQPLDQEQYVRDTNTQSVTVLPGASPCCNLATDQLESCGEIAVYSTRVCQRFLVHLLLVMWSLLPCTLHALQGSPPRPKHRWGVITAQAVAHLPSIRNWPRQA